MYLTGLGTTFGLNPDGTIDTEDNGRGASILGGYNTRDPNLKGVALPQSVLDRISKDPAILKRLNVEVTGPTGKDSGPVVDIGPGEGPQKRGVITDLTYGMTKAVGASGKDPVSLQITLDGKPVLPDMSEQSPDTATTTDTAAPARLGIGAPALPVKNSPLGGRIFQNVLAEVMQQSEAKLGQYFTTGNGLMGEASPQFGSLLQTLAA